MYRRAFDRIQRLAGLALERAAGSVGGMQAALGRRFPRYLRGSARLARLASYALTGDQHYARRSLHRPRRDSVRIQVFRRGAIGDVLLTTPVLRALRAAHPRADISFGTLLPELLLNNPHVDEVITAAAPLPGFDLTYEMMYEDSPDIHVVDAYAQIARVSVVDRTPELYLSEDEVTNGAALLARHGIDLARPVVAFHPESGWPVRNWPLAHFRKVAGHCEDRGWQAVILGTKGSAIDFGTDLRARTSIREAAAVLSRSSALVCIDSGLMHVAAALRLPMVATFGCTDPRNYLPDWALADAVFADVPCRGCHHRQRPLPIVAAPVCPYETIRCMTQTGPGRVIDRLNAVMRRQGAFPSTLSCESMAMTAKSPPV